MNTDAGADDLERLTRTTQAIWDRNAAFWDERMGEGNDFQHLLIAPASERLLALRRDDYVLEVACGNGQFARRLATLGARVLACDFSAAMLERAKARTMEHADRIEYRLVDATDEAQLLALGEGRFTALVCNMALMDMSAIEPLMCAAARLLTSNGRFVFSTMHPCFNSGPITWMLEEEDQEGEIITTRSVKISHYHTPSHARGLGMIGQPVPQYYFHRSLSDILAVAFRTGLVLDGIEEPVFDDATTSPRPLSWANYREIPPVLVARLRRYFALPPTLPEEV